MTKRTIVILVAIAAVVLILMARDGNKDADRSVEGPKRGPSVVEEFGEPRDEVPALSPGSESPGNNSVTDLLPAGPFRSHDAVSLPGPTAGQGEAESLAPEASAGPQMLPSSGPAPEAGDTGIMGLAPEADGIILENSAPEAGDTGIMGLPPGADGIILENSAPEAGQPTTPGLAPEASDPGIIGPAPEDSQLLSD